VPRIEPADQPFTVAEVREHVAELLKAYAGEPGVELLGLVAGMLENTRCSCEPATVGEATVLQLPTSRP
jgi:hypothetical protein